MEIIQEQPKLIEYLLQTKVHTFPSEQKGKQKQRCEK